ncbi:TetR/AcrR family transcriptional regulator [Mycolicibacter kumamotonensis]|uniref:TetR/AcrR family transcriptional regulator n=1 Tax=Mycolicibacter kumamotonensis TaxID=354243 RepID=UPI000A00C88C|nr:TetR/AcrR family transcriptional regulator [Mycolicibacter kumamotonensis]
MPRSKRLGRPTGSIGEATRRRILEIAMKHVGQHGYAGATFNNIAEEAGFTSGAVYYYFKSKKDLVVAVIADVTAQLLARFERAAATADTLQTQLIAILEETIAVTDEMPHLASFSVSVRVDGRRYSELSRALAYSSGAYYGLYRRLVDEAAARGELAPGVDPRDVTDMFGSISFGLTVLTVELPGDRHRVAIRTIEKLLTGSLFPTVSPGNVNGSHTATDMPPELTTVPRSDAT